VQPAQDELPEAMRLLAAPLSPPLLKPNTDITRRELAELHLGQVTGSSLRNTSVSNFSQQSQHSYS